METFTAVLAALLRGDTGRPLITFYDLDTGERVEQSVATYANWVAKAAGLLSEYDAERGTPVDVALPAHWLTPVFVGAAAHLGAVLSPGADLRVVGPEAIDQSGGTTLACSLLPLGRPFVDPLPAGVVDVGKEVWSQPDSFMPWEAAAGTDALTEGHTQAEAWTAAADDAVVRAGGRLLTRANPAREGFAAFCATLARGASLVLVRGEGDLDRLAEQERVTDRT